MVGGLAGQGEERVIECWAAERDLFNRDLGRPYGVRNGAEV
jgi:hypothetical protein